MKHGRFLRLVACALAAVAAPAWAQLPISQLTSVSPPGGKQGSTVELTISGNDLDETEKLVFSHPGIVAAPKMTAATDLVPAKLMPNVFSITIAGDVPPGLYDVTAVSRFGMSNPRSFAVGTLNEVLKAGNNNTPQSAQEVAVGTTISGTIAAANFDYFRLPLKQGERVILDCAAERLDSRMDATLVVLGPNGRELARVRDGVGSDPVLDFSAPAEGTYVVKLQDAIYGGGPEYFYRLSISAAPFVDFVFPPSGLPGTNGQYTLYGRNLPGGQPADGLMIAGAPLQKVLVTIPLPGDELGKSSLAPGAVAPVRKAWQDAVEFRLPTPQGLANPVNVYFAKAPVVAEAEPNNEPAKAQKVTVPCEYVGQFYAQADKDWIQFDAKKGDVLQIEAISHQLGLESDPYIALFKVTKNDKGEEQVADVAQVDDPQERAQRINSDYDTTTDDPSYKLTVNEDATYRLMIRDQFGDARRDPSYIYRLAIRPAAPDFRLLAYANAPVGNAQQEQNQTKLAAATVRRGGSSALTVSVNRRDEFTGEVAVSVEGLPAGVTCPGAILGGEVGSAMLVLTAAEDAAPWAGAIKVIGKGKVGDQEVTREARYACVVWGVQNRQQQAPEFRLSRSLQLGVIDKDIEPALVEVGEGKIYDTSLGANVEIPLKVTRRGDFKEPIKLVPAGLPNEIKPKDLTIDGAKADGKLEIALTQQNIKPGSYTFYLRGETKRKYVRNPDAVATAENEQKQYTEMVAKLNEAVKATAAARDAAVKAAAEAANAVKAADAKKTQAATDLKAKTDAAKAAADKLTAAKDAAAKDGANAGLADAVKAAEKAAADADAAKKKSEEDLAAADKALAEALAVGKKADEAKVAAEAAAKGAADKVAQATPMKAQVDKKVADAKTANQPKDVQFSLVSTPIRLRIAAHPFKVEVPAPAPFKQDAKQELTVKLERLYGFADQVELTFDAPGVPGLSSKKVDLAKDKTEAKLELAAGANTPVGQHKGTVRARGRFNNVQVDALVPVVVTIEAK
ncbi:MAG: hypothetical protein SFU86_18960 [Pirellulaceae bacterium]|nr:hypothetical protein [Pirellulaceae bacterium]